MESFDQKITQESTVKSEVSDVTLSEVCANSDDESLSSSTRDYPKRPCDDEQDSSMDSNGNSLPLPPRKRAKTQEEKEQRRIERIMRNRQAAHASREKKRKHLEMLEGKCTQLEAENAQLKAALSSQGLLKARVEQLENAIKLAKSSGDVASLNSIKPMQDSALTTNYPLTNGTVAGAIVGGTPSPENELSVTAQGSGSPAPSLEEDCASPEALFIKSEEDLFPPYSPEKAPEDLEDPFGMMNFSFDLNPASTGMPAHSDGSSKSRHPAALTQLLEELEFVGTEY